MAEPTNLRELVGKRCTFIGTFSRFGWYTIKMKNTRYIKDVVMLINITDENGNSIKEKLSFNLTKGFQELELKRGDIISFLATVETYQRKEYVPYTEEKIQANEEKLAALKNKLPPEISDDRDALYTYLTECGLRYLMWKGEQTWCPDYKLTHPAKIQIIGFDDELEELAESEKYRPKPAWATAHSQNTKTK
ncbi:hypothetical protein [Methanorbis furvi]|uniref:Uncharacterized protein n=1 Tax=Methanorbis furvi TaxID=3028299 RepID=A0AAE4SBN1_9EURY|nr:hypothetical protein [Methanocorpusculaceae archaeon Ag1]